MNPTPVSFKIPLNRFDLNLLPPECRQVGTEAFQNAVLMHFAEQYAAKGEQVIVTVDSEEINVMTVPQGTDPLDFVMTMLQSGRIQEAVPYLESMTKTDPNNVQVLYNLGIAYSELGQFDEAIIRLKRAVQLDPKHARAWTGIGFAYQRMRKNEQALEAMQKAVEADPTDGYARRNLGAMLLGAGQHAEALEQFRAARQALPHDAQTIYGLASALEAIGGEQNLEEADELYLVLIRKYPGNPLAEMARTARTKLSHQSMRAGMEGHLRPDVVMYLTSALDTFDEIGPAKRQQLTFEIAMKGQNGLDINDPEPKYTLDLLPGKFSGMQLVSMMYAGIKQINPNMDAGIDLAAEYEAALAMRKNKN